MYVYLLTCVSNYVRYLGIFPTRNLDGEGYQYETPVLPEKGTRNQEIKNSVSEKAVQSINQSISRSVRSVGE